MTMMKMARLLVIILITYSFSSCIFEDRSGCPAYFNVDFTDVPLSIGTVYLVYQFQNGEVCMDTVFRHLFDTYERTVPRERFYLAAFGNICSMQYSNGLEVPFGAEADSIYTDFRELYCDDDFLYDKISLKKDFIRLSVRVMGYGRDYDSLYLEINSTAVGYDLYGNVLRGKYRHRPCATHVPKSANDFYEFSSRLIRQQEDDIVIDLYVSTDGESDLVKSINVSDLVSAGEVVVDSTDDLFVIIDFSLSVIVLSPVGWDYTDFVEIEI